MRENVLLFFFIALFIFSAIMLLFQVDFNNLNKITGKVTEGTTESNVTITKYFSMAFSENLSQGISFGNIDSLPAEDINASNNYDGGDSGSTMFINISEDSNTNVDLCIKGDSSLESSGADVIGIGNQTYSNSSSTNLSIPGLENQISLTLTYNKAGPNNQPGNSTYYRFWLDIPAATPSGDYNNTISFKGVESGTNC